MISAQQTVDHEEVGFFLRAIYGDETGYCYVALKSPDANHHAFSQFFFQWPEQQHEAIDFILTKKIDHEVYYSPALFSEKSSKKEAVKGSRVFWVELDGKVPDKVDGIPDPSIIIQSSTEDHAHWYWQTDTFVGVDDIERVNRGLTHLLGADSSGWDANQILRPPSTFNHKRKKDVELIQTPTGKKVKVSDFASLPEPPVPVGVPIPTSLPDVEDVVSKYPVPALVWQLFKNGRPEGHRSEGLMSLGYYFAEMQMENNEIFAMILNADMRWGKFKNRSDQYQRLAEIVTIARKKFPLHPVVDGEKTTNSILQGNGFLSFINAEYNFEWVIDGWIQKQGYTLITGPSGVGKTQFSLDCAMHLALGNDVLERKVERPWKVGMLSLEMGGPDLQMFAGLQAKSYSKEQLEKLDQNFIVEALGEPIYMDTPSGRELVTQWIGDNKLQGVFIDSLGSSLAGELSQEGPAKQLMDWNDRVRQQLGCFTWFIHHHRKASGENKKPNKLADVYGSHWITARATSVVCLWDLGLPQTLQVIPLKMRLSADKNPFLIHRGTNLRFSLKKEGITQVEPETPDEVLVQQAEQEEFNSVTPAEGAIGI